jgi:2-polyprenyl-3-methyl-5-hydroxy-6-metoxy-1,4-benzoquinol methylase
MKFTSYLENSDNPILRWVHSALIQQVRRAVIAYSGANKSLLDYGGGDGKLVRQLSQYFSWAAGIDIDLLKLEAAHYLGVPANGVFLHTDQLEELQQKVPNAFDVVVLSQVLEHTSDLNREVILKNLIKLTHSQSILIIEVPIESGRILFLKSLGGLLLEKMTGGKYQRDRYTIKEVLDRLSIQRAPHIRHPHPTGSYYGHKDFSVCNLYKFLKSYCFVEEIRYISFPLTRWFNLQALFICYWKFPEI